MKKNKKTIVTSVVVALILAVVLILVYAFTDLLKSEKQLFAKYIIQNARQLEEIIDIERFEEISEKLKENKNEEQSIMTIQNSTNNTIELTIDSQNDPVNDKTYKNIKLETKDGKETIEAEFIKENEIYSLRFSNAVKEFLSIRNENLKKLAENIGIDKDTINKIPNNIDFENYSLEGLGLSNQKLEKQTKKYLTLIYNNIPKESYRKSKDVKITVNGNDITTNKYTLALTEKQLKNVEIKMLEELKKDETIINILLTIEKIVNDSVDTELVRQQYLEFMQKQIDNLQKQQFSEETKMLISVYGKSGRTLRIKIEGESDEYTIDTITDEEKKVNIKYDGIDNYQKSISNTISIIKNESDNNLTVEIINIQGGKQQKNIMNIETKQESNNIELKVNIDLENEFIKKITLNSNINFVKELNYREKLDNTNNVILNDLSAEKATKTIEQIGEKVLEKYTEPILEIVTDFILPIIFGEIESVL